MARILIGNVKGPKGDPGPQGIQGEIGPTGPQGPLPPLINNFLTTVAGVSALDAVAGKTLKDLYDGLNSNLDKISGDVGGIKPVTNRNATSVADNTDYNNLNQPGWYSIFSNDISVSHAPANGLARILLRVDSVNINGVWITIQTAIEWYTGSTITSKTYKRWSYVQNGTFLWSVWQML